MVNDGWEQVRSGLELIVWSKLAHWNAPLLALSAANSDIFESEEGWQVVHPECGRLLCWIALGVGGEYLVKGAFMLNGHPLAREVDVIRPPLQGEKIKDWVNLVNSDDQSIWEKDISFGTLGKKTLANLPRGKGRSVTWEREGSSLGKHKTVRERNSQPRRPSLQEECAGFQFPHGRESICADLQYPLGVLG